METLTRIAVLVLLISLATFVALFGRLPAFRNTPIGFLNRMVWFAIPEFLQSVDRRVTGGRIISHLGRGAYYLMNENHPCVLILFISILLGSEILLIPPAWSRVSSFHHILIVVLSVTPYVTIYRCATSKSSTITWQNHKEQVRKYPYDHVLFRPNQTCRTCHFTKPARSKHCSICKVCVARHDHHCIWVMNCLGSGNYAYFIAMMFSLSILLTYGAYLSFSLLTELLQTSVLRGPLGPGERFSWSKGKTWSQYFQLWSWAISKDFRLGGVGMLAFLTTPLAWGLFLYHLYLIWAGMTTNESFKWTEWKDDIADGLVYRYDGNAETLDQEETGHEAQPGIKWPIYSSQKLVKRAYRPGGGVGRDADQRVDSLPQSDARDPKWRRVNSLEEVENIYDLGFWDNLLHLMSTT